MYEVFIYIYIYLFFDSDSDVVWLGKQYYWTGVLHVCQILAPTW